MERTLDRVDCIRDIDAPATCSNWSSRQSNLGESDIIIKLIFFFVFPKCFFRIHICHFCCVSASSICCCFLNPLKGQWIYFLAPCNFPKVNSSYFARENARVLKGLIVPRLPSIVNFITIACICAKQRFLVMNNSQIILMLVNHPRKEDNVVYKAATC